MVDDSGLAVDSKDDGHGSIGSGDGLIEGGGEGNGGEKEVAGDANADADKSEEADGQLDDTKTD